MIVTLIDTAQAMSLMPYVFMLPFYENYIFLYTCMHTLLYLINCCMEYFYEIFVSQLLIIVKCRRHLFSIKKKAFLLEQNNKCPLICDQSKGYFKCVRGILTTVLS